MLKYNIIFYIKVIWAKISCSSNIHNANNEMTYNQSIMLLSTRISSTSSNLLFILNVVCILLRVLDHNSDSPAVTTYPFSKNLPQLHTSHVNFHCIYFRLKMVVRPKHEAVIAVHAIRWTIMETYTALYFPNESSIVIFLLLIYCRYSTVIVRARNPRIRP
jgi:hypothetical protein